MTDKISDYDLGFQDGASGLAPLYEIHPSQDYSKGYDDGHEKFIKQVFG